MTTGFRRLLAAASTLLLVSAVFVVGQGSVDQPAFASADPSFTSIVPAEGLSSGGFGVTVTGSGFGTQKSSVSAELRLKSDSTKKIELIINSVSETQITATVPSVSPADRFSGNADLQIRIGSEEDGSSVTGPNAFEFLPTGVFGGFEGSFNVGNYGTGLSTGGFFQRGYAFTVSQPTQVTGLQGRATGTSGVFFVALYTATTTSDVENGIYTKTTNPVVSLTSLLGSAEFTLSSATNNVNQDLTLSEPVILVPGQVYILAQARLSGSGSHTTVTGLNLQDLLSSPRISTWGPNQGVYRWDRGAQSAEHHLTESGPQNLDINNFLPALGLIYSSAYEPPKVRTNPDDSAVEFSTNSFTIRGFLEDSGQGDDPVPPDVQLAFEWGTSANVSVTGTFTPAVPSSTTETRKEFSLTLSNQPPGTYYYRAIAINEASRVNGEVKEFVWQPLPIIGGATVLATGPTTSEMSANLSNLSLFDITNHGFCFGTSNNPSLGGAGGAQCIDLGPTGETGEFSAPITWDASGSSVKVRAFATNAAGTAYSAQAEITAPTNSSSPTVLGSDFETGAAVVGTEGTWNDGGLSITQTSYQWRATLSGETIDIPGATSLELPCLPSTPGIVGSTLTLAVTKTNLIGSTTVTSSSSGVVTDGGPCASPPPPAAPPPPRPAVAPVPPPVVQAPVAVPGRTTPVAPAPAPAPVTGPVLRGNVVPTAPQQPVARVGTRDIPVTTQVNTPNRLDVRASSVSLGVSVPQTVGGVRQQAGGPTELEVRSGGQTTLQGGGVLAGSAVQVFMPLQGDNAKQIAQIEADATGTFNGDAVFATQRSETPLPIGRQVLQIVSLDDTGQQVVIEMAVVIAQPPPAPEFDRSVDALPTVPPGQSIATEAGLPVQVAVRAETENRQAVIEADDWSMAISVAGQDASVEETPEGGASLTFVRDETASVQGSGFMPGTRADVWLFSEPTLLGTVTIDDNGEFNGEISVDGRIVTVGEHTLQLQGVGSDGYVRSANLGVVVKDADAEVATTADVAASFAWWFWIIGLFALLLVAIIAYWLYRRARQEAA